MQTNATSTTPIIKYEYFPFAKKKHQGQRYKWSKCLFPESAGKGDGIFTLYRKHGITGVTLR